MRDHAFTIIIVALALLFLASMRLCAQQRHVQFGGFRHDEQVAP